MAQNLFQEGKIPRHNAQKQPRKILVIHKQSYFSVTTLEMDARLNKLSTENCVIIWSNRIKYFIYWDTIFFFFFINYL